MPYDEYGGWYGGLQPAPQTTQLPTTLSPGILGYINDPSLDQGYASIPQFDFGKLTTGWTQSPAGLGLDQALIDYYNATYAPGINNYLQQQLSAGTQIGPHSDPSGIYSYGIQPGSTDRIYASPATLQNLFSQAGVPSSPGAQQYIDMFNQNYLTSEQTQRALESAQTKGDFTKFGAAVAAILGGAALAAAAGGAGAAGGAAAGGEAAGGLGGFSAADLSAGFASLPAGSAGTVGGGAGLSTAAGSGALVPSGSWLAGYAPSQIAGTTADMGFFDSLFGGGTDSPWGVNLQESFDPSAWSMGGEFDPQAAYTWSGDLSGYPMTGTDTAGLYDAGYGYANDAAGLFGGSGGFGVQDILGLAQKLGVSPSGLLSKLVGSSNNSGSSLLGSLLGGGGGGGINWGGLLGNAIGTAAEVGPIIAGLNYANNLPGADTSRLESLYNQYNPQAATLQYDINTGYGRNQLNSNLARRGVSGSSFANMDVGNFNTLRDIGRQQLINNAVGPQADIANQIMQGQLTNQKLKTDLYGRGLQSLGVALGSKDSSLNSLLANLGLG